MNKPGGCLTCSQLTRPGENLVGLVAEQLGEPRPLGIDGLLHGFDSHPQVAVLRLQHRVLMEHVTEAFHTILTRHAFTLQETTCHFLCATVLPFKRFWETSSNTAKLIYFQIIRLIATPAL